MTSGLACDIILNVRNDRNPTRERKKRYLKMFRNLFKKESKKSNHYRVIYKWCGTDEMIEMFATSAGLATMDADPMIEIVKVIAI